MLAIRHEQAVQNIIKLFDECGYKVSLTLVDTKNYRLAQTRERIFYIGFKKEFNIDFVFPKGLTLDDSKKITLKDVIWDLKDTAVPALNKNHLILM